MKDLTIQQISILEEYKLDLPGVNYKKFPERYYSSEINGSHFLGYLKEVELSIHNREVRSKNRVNFLQACDKIIAHGVSTMKQLTKYRELESSIDRKLDYVSHPVNIDLYYDTFYSTEKEESIFAYLPNPTHRRAETYNFARYISEKYNIPLVLKPKTDSPDIKIDMS